jgi:hypothetical protein
MKWDKPDGSVQWSAGKRYCVVQANSRDWIPYEMGPTTGRDLGTKPTAAEARELCEARERTKRQA